MENSDRQALRSLPFGPPSAMLEAPTTDRDPDAKTPLDGRDFPSMPFYTGTPWFLPLVSLWYRLKDRMAR